MKLEESHDLQFSDLEVWTWKRQEKYVDSCWASLHAYVMLSKSVLSRAGRGQQCSEPHHAPLRPPQLHPERSGKTLAISSALGPCPGQDVFWSRSWETRPVKADHDWEPLQVLRTHWPRRWSGNGGHAGKPGTMPGGFISLSGKWLAFLRGHWAQLLCLVCLGWGVHEWHLPQRSWPSCVSTGSGGPFSWQPERFLPPFPPTFPQRGLSPSHTQHIPCFSLALQGVSFTAQVWPPAFPDTGMEGEDGTLL